MTGPQDIRRRPLPGRLRHLAAQLVKAHDQLAPLDAQAHAQRVTILGAAITIDNIAEELEQQ